MAEPSNAGNLADPTDSAPAQPLRRLARDLIWLVVAKIAVLTLIWWVAIAPQPRPDTRPAAIEHLLAPASDSPKHADTP